MDAHLNTTMLGPQFPSTSSFTTHPPRVTVVVSALRGAVGGAAASRLPNILVTDAVPHAGALHGGGPAQRRLHRLVGKELSM